MSYLYVAFRVQRRYFDGDGQHAAGLQADALGGRGRSVGGRFRLVDGRLQPVRMRPARKLHVQRGEASVQQA